VDCPCLYWVVSVLVYVEFLKHDKGASGKPRISHSAAQRNLHATTARDS